MISVIYVNFNTTDVLTDSLRSLQDHFRIDHEVIVVDNASTHQPLDTGTLLEEFPAVKLVMLPGNLGFGMGNNRGADQAIGEVLWILNTDTVLPEDHNLEAALQWLQSHEDYAAVTPLLLDPDGSIQQGQVGRFPTVGRLVADKLRWRGALGYPTDGNGRDVDWATGAALLVRAEAFRAVEGFSPEFFFFFEDIDLSRKFADIGLKVRHNPESRVIHIKGSSATSQSRRKLAYYAAQDVYFSRWHRPLAARTVSLLSLPLRWRYGRRPPVTREQDA